MFHISSQQVSQPGRIVGAPPPLLPTPFALCPVKNTPATGSFAMQEKGSNRLVLGPDYMVDALKLPNQASRFSGESLQMCVAWRCPDGTQHLFCWPILAVSGQSLASNGPVIDSRYLNLVFGHNEATHDKLFLSSSTKYTVEPFWLLVLVWPPFELLHRALNTIVFAQYCRM
ncbi:hypothetical protein TNCV_1261491 [Trichonephila clavipes]|nr:hypothetical protein TNCV_1261491 [Trichonephila clavipes]